MPPNQVEVNLKFKRILSAKVMGKLAEKTPRRGDSVQGVIVTHNFQSKIVAPEDVATFTPLRLGSITSKLHVPFAGSVETLKLFLCEMFNGVKDEVFSDGDETKGRMLTLQGGTVRSFLCSSSSSHVTHLLNSATLRSLCVWARNEELCQLNGRPVLPMTFLPIR